MSLICQNFKLILFENKEYFYEMLVLYKDLIFSSETSAQFIVLIIYNIFGMADKDIKIFNEVNEKLNFLKDFEKKFFK